MNLPSIIQYRNERGPDIWVGWPSKGSNEDIKSIS